MKQMIYRAAGLLTGVVMLCTIAGCGKDKNGEGKIRVIENSMAETTEESIQEVDVKPGVMGEEFATDSVTATMDSVCMPAYTFKDNDKELSILFFQLTVTNHSDEALPLNFLSQSFSVQADGEAFAGITLRGPRFILLQFGEGAEAFADNIQPEETRQGYVCVEVPADFEHVKLMYYPNAGLIDWSQAFSFEMDRSDIQPAPDPVTPY